MEGMGGIREIQGYEPFGSMLPGRNYGSDRYCFGFQGQVKDDEVYGSTGTSYAFEYRMHDPRVGRFLSIDPLADKYPFYSPYAFSGNRVLDRVELEGLEPVMLPGVSLGKHVLPLLSNVRPVGSLREYGENLEQHGSKVQMASLPLVLANPLAADAVATAGGTASLLGTGFQAAADIKEGKYREGIIRIGLAASFQALGIKSNKIVNESGLSESQSTASKIAVGIVLDKMEGAIMSEVEKFGPATENNTTVGQSSSSSAPPEALPLPPVTSKRTTGTDQLEQ